MDLRAVRIALGSLLVLAFCQDLRVSSFALLQNLTTSFQHDFPDRKSNDRFLENFWDHDNSHPVENYNSIMEEKAEAPAALIGGQYAKVGQFPWMAIVHRLKSRVSRQFLLCGGTIISHRWILTAGHCVVDYPRRFLIVLGDRDKSGINYDSYNGPGLSMITTKGALHPQYNPEFNDIGLVWIPRDITFSDVIQPIRLAGMNEAGDIFAGQMGLVIGWGREAPNQIGSSQRLKYLSTLIIMNNECRRTWRVYDTNVCTAAGFPATACQGDSGGPLVVRVNNEYLQVGVVSYGDVYCSSISPGVFTRVSTYAQWIHQITGISYR